MFQTAFANIAILVVGMTIGFAAKKGGVIGDKDIPGLSGVTLNIALPALMLMSMQREFDAAIFANSLLIMGLAVLTYMSCFALSYPLTKLLKTAEDERPVYKFSLIFSNNGFMGIPVVYAIFGAEAMFYAAMINVVFNIILFTIGIFIMRGEGSKGKMGLKSVLFNKIILSTIVGFLFFVFSIRIPEILGSGLTMLGSMTTPLAMIVTGALLASNDIKSVFTGWRIYVVVLFRLLILPLLVFFILRWFISDGMVLTILTIITAMPVAVIMAILAAEHGKAPHLASKIVFVSTVLSIFTIPFIVFITSIFV